MSLCIVYLASPRDFRLYETPRIDILRKSLAITRRCFPTTDIFIFHEDYTDEDKASLPGVKEFIRVDFTPPPISTQRRPGYLMMCRFFCGPLQAMPQLQAYTHYMRLDDDSFFLPPYLTEESVRPLLVHDYVYRSLFVEDEDQTSLLDFTLRFRERQGVFPILLRQRLQTQGIVRGGRYTGLAPYNNFHISSLRLWRHPRVRAFLAELESRQAILRYGWLDANIHAMILWVLDVTVPHHVSDFGYRHNVHISYLGSLFPMISTDDWMALD
jgi:hypothetical protein